VVARNISKRDRQKEEKTYKIKWLYPCFGISKQAYYKRIKADNKKQLEAITIKKLILDYRKDQSRCGIKKMYVDLKGQLQQESIKRGRDALFDFARDHDLLVSKTKRYHIATDSRHGYFKSPNLIKTLLPTKAEQVFVSDITYIRREDDRAY